jgi:AsmA protein
MLKKILIGIAALLLLVILVLAALLAMFDADRYKPRIEQAVHDQLDRTLKFDGRLSLSVFPTIALALPRTTLSERGSETPFLSLERARVSLALLPLLSGRVQAGSASLYGLRATIEQRADGTTNLDDLTSSKQPKTAAPEAPRAAGPAAQFELGGIELVDAQVVYRDERSRNTVTVSKLNLRTGRVATRASTPVDFSASITATEPPSSFDLSLKATADIDLVDRALAVRDLDAHARGRSGPDQFDVALAVPKISLGPAQAKGERVKLAATVTGEHPARVELALEDIASAGDKLSIGKIDGELDLESAALPQRSLKVKLDGSISVDSRAQGITARLAAHFDDTNVTARVDAHGFSAPRIGLDADVDRLNLDRYLRGAAPAAPLPLAGEGPGVRGGAESDPKVDLSALKSLKLAGELRIGALQVHNLKATKVKVAVNSAGGHLEVAPLSASLYQGALNGSAKVDANANRVAANLVLNGISIEPLVKDLTGRDLIEGQGGLKLDIATSGPTVGAMRHALGGSASLALHDGAIRGINIVQKLRDLKSALSTGAAQSGAADETQKTDFSELTATFSIKNGVATNNDLLASSPLLRVNGAGIIDIGAGALDYTVQASVVETAAGLSDLRGVAFPVHLSGPFAALSYRLDWNSLARQAITTKAGEQLKNLLSNKLKKGAQPSNPNLGDALKGLLGK